MPPEWSTFAEFCPSRTVLDCIAEKWVALVLGRLAERPHRFNELRRDVGGISQKMLSQTLKSLERRGLVTRSAFATVPVTVEYAITPLGRTLAAVLDQLRGWAETHIEEVHAAEKAYTERQE